MVNHSRMAAGLAAAFDHDGAECLCVVVKGTFALPAARDVLRLADEQVAPFHANIYMGEPGESSVKYPADLISGKTATDVLLIGTARSPSSRPVQRLEASVRVGELHRRVIVTGDRRWEKRFGGSFVITEPEPFNEMPIVYERAYGGADRTARDGADQWDARNPVGTGFIASEGGIEGTWVPNIEDPESLISSWKDRPPVAGFGAIDVTWEPRSLLSGTYDEDWLATQAPFPPSDVQPRFFNAAPSGLIAGGFLAGGESVELVNVAEEDRIVFRLPHLDVLITPELRGERFEHSAALWTVMFEPDERRFIMVWGSAFAIGKQPSQARSIEIDVQGAMADQLR